MEVVYDYRRTQRIRNGDAGTETLITESRRGEFPPCFPQEYSEEFSIKTGEASYYERCSCDHHVIYFYEVPEGIWPEDIELRIRVVKED